MTEQLTDIEPIVADEHELTTYSYISNGLCFEYFIGLEIAALLDYKYPHDTVKNTVSRCNQLIFREYPGVKQPRQNPRTILITRDGVKEILLKTRKLINPTVKYILDKFQFDITNAKSLSKEQKNLSFITNAFKIEETIPQYPVGSYFLDLYFPEYKIIIECDELGHADRNPLKERQREEYVNNELGTTVDNWVRFNPDDMFFDIANVVAQIHRRISQEKVAKNVVVQQEKVYEKIYVQTMPKLLTEEDKQKILASAKSYNHKRNINLLPEKPCTYCNIVKPLDQFHNAKDHRDGKENICKPCKRKKDLERAEKNRAENGIPTEKQCNICNEIKNIDCFYKESQAPDGHMKRCIDCHKIKAATPQTYIIVEEKMCKACNITKQIDEFHKTTKSPDGHNIYCKECAKKKSKVMYDKNKDKYLEKKKEKRAGISANSATVHGS